MSVIELKCSPSHIFIRSDDNSIMKDLQKLTIATLGKPDNDKEWFIISITDFPALLPVLHEFNLASTSLREIAALYNAHTKKEREVKKVIFIPSQPTIETRGNWLYLRDMPEAIIPALDEELSYDYPKKKHIKAVEQGLWDGKKHLLKKYEDHYRCRRGLLERVLLLLKSKDVRYVQKQLTHKIPDPTFETTYNGPQLWEHQEVAFTKCRTKESGIISIATGGGKTILMTRLTQYYSVPTNIFINSVDVARQLYNVFVKTLGSENVGFIGDSECEVAPKKINIILLPTAFLALWSLGITKKWKVTLTEEGKKEYKLKQCTVSTVFYQTIVDTILNAKMSLFDECDILGAETYSAVSACTHSLYNFGFSATPYRNDGKDLEIEAGCGRVIYEIGVSDLIDVGVLVPAEVHIYAVPRSIDLKSSNYSSIYKVCIKENSLRNLMITKIAKQFTDQGMVGIILVKRIEQGKELHRRLKHEGVDSKFLQGRDSAITRLKAIVMLQKRDLQVIVTTLFGRGTDIPELDFGIRAKAEGATIIDKHNSDISQVTGRILRKIPGKSIAYMVDFIDPYLFLRDHSQARIDAYKDERRFEVIFKEFTQE